MAPRFTSLKNPCKKALLNLPKTREHHKVMLLEHHLVRVVDSISLQAEIYPHQERRAGRINQFQNT